MVILIDTDKTFDKIQYTLLIKFHNKLGIYPNFINLIKDIY